MVAACRSGKSRAAEALVYLSGDARPLVLIVVPTVAIAAEFLNRVQFGTLVYSKQLLGECASIEAIEARLHKSNDPTTVVVTVESLFKVTSLDVDRRGHKRRVSDDDESKVSTLEPSRLLSAVEKNASRLKAVVIDEVHILLEADLGYRPAYWWLVDRLRGSVSSDLSCTPVLGMTATLSSAGEQMLCDVFGISRADRYGPPLLQLPDVSIVAV